MATLAIFVTTAFAVTTTAAAATTATATAATALVRKEFSMESFCELLLCSLSYRNHLTGEIERLACHRMVEIHYDSLFLHFEDHSWNDLSLAVEHRYHATYLHCLLLELAVNHECGLRELYNLLLLVFAVSVLRADSECEFISWLLAFESFLELREEHVCSVDVVKRLSL